MTEQEMKDFKEYAFPATDLLESLLPNRFDRIFVALMIVDAMNKVRENDTTLIKDVK
jgi:hypothetical protein